MSGPAAAAFVDLVDRARRLVAADRIEVSLAGGSPVVIGLAADDAEPVAHLQVQDEDGLLAELVVYGGEQDPGLLPEMFPELLRQLAAVAAAVADRDRAVGREEVWVGRLGHDLKTPLTAVLGFSGLIAGGGLADASPELTTAAAGVVDTGERLLADLEDLLVLWRRPPGPV